MTPISLRFAVALFVSATALTASPLMENASVHAKPDASAPVIATLQTGSEPVVAIGVPAPSGWSAVTLAGPHDVYAANKDVTKSLDVRVGSPYLTEAKPDAPVFTLAEKDDIAEIIDYRGKWTKFRLSKDIVGYIKTPANSAPFSTTAAAAPQAQSTSSSSAPSIPVTNIGKAAPVGDGGSSALPRLFQGKFASTYSALRPRRPYDFQLNDEAGARYAYVDISKLLATEQLNKYIDRTVVVYGTARAVPGSKDMVVVAESLQLR